MIDRVWSFGFAVLYFSMLPTIMFVDYWLFKGTQCPNCKGMAPRNAWLLPTIVEMFIFFVGLCLGLLTR